MTVKIPEGSAGVSYNFTLKQEGSSTAEDLSSFTAAVLIVTSYDEKTIHNSSISLSFVDKPNGIVRYTSNFSGDSFPTVPKRQESLQIKGQITLTGVGVEDSTFVFPIEIVPKIVS